MPTEDVKRLYEEYGRDGAIIVSPSNVIPETDEKQPPHKQAAKYYGKVADQKDGTFRVTMGASHQGRSETVGSGGKRVRSGCHLDGSEFPEQPGTASPSRPTTSESRINTRAI